MVTSATVPKSDVDAETVDDKSGGSVVLVSVGFQNDMNKVGSEGVIGLCKTAKNLKVYYITNDNFSYFKRFR